MARLPKPGGDSGNWGTILNDYLSESHNTDGTLKNGLITTDILTPSAVTSGVLADSSVTNSKIAASAGIEKSKLATDIQASLTKADSAAQPADVAIKYTKPSSGIPLSDINKTELDNSYATTNRAFYHSMAGATAGMANGAPSFTSDSGHTASWARANTSQQINTGTLNGKGGFWGIPSGTAAYLATPDMGAKVKHAKMRFLVAQGSGGTGGTACLAITNQRLMDGLPGYSSFGMACHFYSTPTLWAYTVWVPGSGQVVIASGTYTVPLIKDTLTEYSLEVWIEGDTAIFIAADGIVRRCKDSRIATYQGNFAYSESYMPGATDDVIGVTAFDAEADGAAEVPSPTSTSGPDVLQAVARSRVALSTAPPRLFAAATVSRPTAASAGTGATMLDTTLNKPLWSDGVNWRDAAGVIV